MHMCARVRGLNNSACARRTTLQTDKVGSRDQDRWSLCTRRPAAVPSVYSKCSRNLPAAHRATQGTPLHNYTIRSNAGNAPQPVRCHLAFGRQQARCEVTDSTCSQGQQTQQNEPKIGGQGRGVFPTIFLLEKKIVSVEYARAHMHTCLRPQNDSHLWLH